MTSAKPFEISKRRVLEAYWHVRGNRGAAGIDDESIEMFEANLSRNLYRLWNRLASGSYFPPPVRQVEIAKKSGDGKRVLGIPTVADRIAQQVVKARIEGELEGLFHPDSYGYRPNKSAIDAVAVTRQRCWKYDWCVEFDIRRAFGRECASEFRFQAIHGRAFLRRTCWRAGMGEPERPRMLTEGAGKWTFRRLNTLLTEFRRNGIRFLSSVVV